MAYDNSNTGALFRNDKGGNEKRPDYRGTLNVDGKEYELASWLKTSKKGDKYMSLTVQPKREQQMRAGMDPMDAVKQGAKLEDFSDEIPFN